MGELRKPLLLVAVFVAVLVVLVELGAGLVVGGGSGRGVLLAQASELGVDAAPGGAINQPSGRGIPYLALLDAVLLYTAALMAASLLVPERLHGRVQGIATFIGSVLLALAAIVLAIIAVVELIVMVTLFSAAPFGTIAYVAVWGAFPRADAAVLLSLLLFLKLVFAVFLVLAHPRFLQQKGLVLLVITSLVANVVVSFLHGIVPRVVVSITDDIAAIVVAIIAVIWAVVLLIGSIPAIVSAVRVTAAPN